MDSVELGSGAGSIGVDLLLVAAGLMTVAGILLWLLLRRTGR
jgi:hypothetical protein